MKDYKSFKKNTQPNLNDKDDFKFLLNNFNVNYNIFPKMRLRRLRKNEAIRDSYKKHICQLKTWWPHYLYKKELIKK